MTTKLSPYLFVKAASTFDGLYKLVGSQVEKSPNHKNCNVPIFLDIIRILF